MDAIGDGNLDALETRAKLQVRIQRTILRHQLIMIGNALIVAYLFALLVLLIWFGLWSIGGTGIGLVGRVAPVMGITPDALRSIGAMLYGVFKIASILLLLCPGLGFRICGAAMRP